MAGRAMLTVFSMFGSEWQADKDEREAVPSAFADYFVATQKQDFPPGVALTMVMCAYVGRRFTMPKTQSRMQALKLRFAAWMIRRKLRKQGIVARVVIQDGEIQIIRDDKPADA